VLFLFVINVPGVDRRDDIEVGRVGQRPLAFIMIGLTWPGHHQLLASRPTGAGPTRWSGHRGHITERPRCPTESRPNGQAAVHHLTSSLRNAGRPVGHRRGRAVVAGPRPPCPTMLPSDTRPRSSRREPGRRVVPRIGRRLFSIGAVGLLVRRNVLIMFMCIELMLNAANLTFVTFAACWATSAGRCSSSSSRGGRGRGRVGLGIVVAIYRRRSTTVADD